MKMVLENMDWENLKMFEAIAKAVEDAKKNGTLNGPSVPTTER
jgi:hypothetical protein